MREPNQHQIDNILANLAAYCAGRGDLLLRQPEQLP